MLRELGLTDFWGIFHVQYLSVGLLLEYETPSLCSRIMATPAHNVAN